MRSTRSRWRRITGVLGPERRGRDEYRGDCVELYGHGVGAGVVGPVIPAQANGQEFSDWWAVDEPCHVGQVFTSEFFVRDPEGGMACFEEILLVTDNVTERLTEPPRLFW